MEKPCLEKTNNKRTQQHIFESKSSLFYRVNFRTAKALRTQSKDPHAARRWEREDNTPCRG